MPSTITRVVSGRIPNDDADTLRRAAERENITVSEVLKRLVHEAVPKLRGSA